MTVTVNKAKHVDAIALKQPFPERKNFFFNFFFLVLRRLAYFLSLYRHLLGVIVLYSSHQSSFTQVSKSPTSTRIPLPTPISNTAIMLISFNPICFISLIISTRCTCCTQYMFYGLLLLTVVTQSIWIVLHDFFMYCLNNYAHPQSGKQIIGALPPLNVMESGFGLTCLFTF